MCRRLTRSTPTSGGGRSRRCGISVRFHFGFTVPFLPHAARSRRHRWRSPPPRAISRLCRLCRSPAPAPGGPRWKATRRRKSSPACRSWSGPDHPASLPVFAVSHPAADAVAAEVEVYSVRVSGWGAAAARTLAPLAEVIAEPDGAFDGAALLISVPQGQTLGRYHRRPGESRRFGAFHGPRRQPRDTRYTVADVWSIA